MKREVLTKREQGSASGVTVMRLAMACGSRTAVTAEVAGVMVRRDANRAVCVFHAGTVKVRGFQHAARCQHHQERDKKPLAQS
jgi:hypothetical protein